MLGPKACKYASQTLLKLNLTVIIPMHVFLTWHDVKVWRCFGLVRDCSVADQRAIYVLIRQIIKVQHPIVITTTTNTVKEYVSWNSPLLALQSMSDYCQIHFLSWWEDGNAKTRAVSILKPVQLNLMLFHCGRTQKAQVMLCNAAAFIRAHHRARISCPLSAFIS